MTELSQTPRAAVGPDTYAINNVGGVIRGCIDLVHSPDDGGWYAQEYDFKRKDSATRTSRQTFRNRESLVRSLKSGQHRWGKWD